MINKNLIGLSPDFYTDTSLFSAFCNSNVSNNPRHLSVNTESILDINYGDPVNSYDVNTHGYRSMEFRENIELLTLGCSQTFGVGSPVESLWGSMLAKNLGCPDSYVNLATPGWSIQAIVQNFFYYCKTYGNPKIVVALLPDPYRMVLPINSNFMAYETSNKNKSITIEDVRLFTGSKESVKFSKRPHAVDSIIPSEVPFYISMQMLNMLIQYCQSSEIKLTWGTWYPAFNSMFKMKNTLGINESYSGYVDIDIDTRRFTECHLELLDKYGDNFYHGLDRSHDQDLATYERSHMGIHSHAHVADKFIEHLGLG
jgi:hypothetical protein